MTINPRMAAYNLDKTYDQIDDVKTKYAQQATLETCALMAEAGKELFANEAEKSDEQLAVEYGGFLGAPTELDMMAAAAVENYNKKRGDKIAAGWLYAAAVPGAMVATVWEAMSLKANGAFGFLESLPPNIAENLSTFAMATTVIVPIALAAYNHYQKLRAASQAEHQYNIVSRQQAAIPSVLEAVGALRAGDAATLAAEPKTPGTGKNDLTEEARFMLDQTRTFPELRDSACKTTCWHWMENFTDERKSTLASEAVYGVELF